MHRLYPVKNSHKNLIDCFILEELDFIS